MSVQRSSSSSNNNKDNRRDLCKGAIGTSFHARRWLALDPCGCSGICLSWSVHLYALIIIPLKITSHSLIASLFYFTAYVPMSLLAMTALFQAWTTNPGAVPMGARPLTIVRRANSSLSSTSSTSSSLHNGEGQQGGTAGAGAGSTLQVQNQRGVRRCHKCNDNYKPPRAHHDSVTGRCIVKFDHFCPWVGNAVGALNHKFFCLFLFYTAICCSISLLLIFIRAVHCGYLIDPESNHPDEKIQQSMRSYEKKTNQHYDNNNSDNSNFTDQQEGQPHRFLRTPTTTVYKYAECNDFYSSHWVWALAVASLVFLIFTCSMGCEQLDAIETGKGKIARMKMSVGSTGTEFSRVTEEFNEMFGGETGLRVSWHWFFPWRPVSFPRSMKKVVLGYEWDDSLQGDEPFYYPDDNGNNSIASVGSDRSIPSAIDALGDREMSELEGGRLKAPPPSSSTMMLPIISNGSLLSHNGLDNYNLDNVPTVPSTSRNNSKDALLMRQDASNVTAVADNCVDSLNGITVENNNNKTTPTVVLNVAASAEGVIGGGSTHSGTFGIKNRIAAQKTAGGGGGGGSGGATLVERTMTRIT